jgi:predicted HTH transcriptional regulator
MTENNRVEYRRELTDGLEKEVVAFLNAVVHNDYSYGATPKLEFFSDRAEVTSMGGLPYGVTEKDFFGGCSVPRNKEIMRVFRDLEIVEHLGSGVPRIVNAYGKEAFEIRDSFIRIIFRFAEAMSPRAKGQSGVESGVESGMALRVFALLKAQPLSKAAIAKALGKKNQHDISMKNNKS